MAGKWGLGPPKTVAYSLKEQIATKILRVVRSKGHPYVELRDNGKKPIFFCILCLAPCYGDTVLFDHLKGKRHTKRLSFAKVTLLLPNPWPFNDGVLFFDTSTENDKDLAIKNSNYKRWLKFDEYLSASEDSHAKDDEIQCGDKCVGSKAVQSDVQLSSTYDTLDDDCTLVIPRVQIGDRIFDVKVREVGLGKIAARFLEMDKILNGISAIWCEWLGKDNNGQQDGVPEHDFALIVFSYHYNLGRSGLLDDDVKSLLPSATMTQPKNKGGSGRKRKKSLSDQYDSSAKDSSASNSATSRLTLEQYDNQLLRSSIILNRAARKELRRKERIAAEKKCFICKQKMLPGKDMAALLNLKTRRIACYRNNQNGSFHTFHTSCLIHWILLSEFDITTTRLSLSKDRRANVNKIGEESEMKVASARIDTVFCPECQGTGMVVDGDGLEPRPYNLDDLSEFRNDARNARREWIESPEVLQNCSIGFLFPSQSEEIVQEKVESIKLLHFYRADEQSQAQELCKPCT